MRLLQLTSDGRLECTDDLLDDEIPPYAILSHTWGEQEVLFQDLQNHVSIRDMDSDLRCRYEKILFCAEQAKRDDLDYFWIDSCCIDKTNSQELQEAIISMFRWYQNAKKCYVYLSDVTDSMIGRDVGSALTGSRWFTRGWTLQELIAPNSVEFFSKEGTLLGDRDSLRDIIHEITKIPLGALMGDAMSDFSTECRFSWTEGRQTKRDEDMAYCLLGIFDISMPVMYGETGRKALSRLKDAIALKSNGGQEAKLLAIKDWITAPDPSTNHHKAIKQRQADTGLWLLESKEFAKWKNSPASRLWLHGIPGCGKTILSSSIIEQLLQRCDGTNAVIAYFYFDFTDAQKRNPELMLRSLFCQIIQRTSVVLPCFDALFLSCNNGKRQPTLQALLNVIPQVMQQLTHIYIVIDALDECAQRSDLMDMLETLAEWPLDNMHLLLTSRKERDIESSIGSYIEREDTINLDRDVVDKDILLYVRQRLIDDKGLAKWNKDTAIKQEIEAALLNRASGMFRWAVCQLDSLAKCRNRSALRRALTTLPCTLDQTYDRILCSISGEDVEYAMRILRWLLFSTRSMTLEEMAEVAAIDTTREPAFDREEVLEDPFEVLNICSSLVTVTTTDSKGTSNATQHTVALAHFSVQEFLISDRVKRGPAKMFSMEEADCHSEIASGSLYYLTQLQQPLSKEIVRLSALALYAARFWSYHLKKGGERDMGLNQLAVGLMSIQNPAYLSWIQLSDPDQPEKPPELDRGMESVPVPLYYAAQLGLSSVTKTLLAQGSGANIRGGRYGSPLHAASRKGHEQVVQILISAGADVNAQSGVYGSALQAAAYRGSAQIVRMLLEAGADVNTQSKKYGSALSAALSGASLGVINLLFDIHSDVNQQDGMYCNALSAAVWKEHVSVVKLLLENGADIGHHDRPGRGTLHFATNSPSGNPQSTVIKLLLSQGASVDDTDFRDMTPLNHTIENGYFDTAGVLDNHGATALVYDAVFVMPERVSQKWRALQTHLFRTETTIRRSN